MLRFVTLRWRTAAVIAGATLVAIAWYATFTPSAESRLLDTARLWQAQSNGGLVGAIAGWWLSVCADPWRPDLVIGLVQAACIPAALILVIRRNGSIAAAVATAAVLLALALPAHWLGRPLGIGPAFAVLGLVVVFAGYADGGVAVRAEMLIASFVAALSAGWPIVPVAVLALLRRHRTTTVVAAAAGLGVVVRVLLGIRAFDAAGIWSASEPHAFLGLRLVFWAVVFTPALLFVVTRPPIAQRLTRLAGGGASPALAAAAVVLGVAGTFLADGSAAVFAACAALVLVAALSIVKRDSAVVRIAVLASAVVVSSAGAVYRVQHPPPDDAELVAGEQRSIRDAVAVNGSLIVVDRSGENVQRRFPPFLLSYLAGRTVGVRYLTQVPSNAPGGVLEATVHGVVRIDPSMRALYALDEARRDMRSDLYAHRLDGKINSQRHEGTPSGLGVIPSFDVAGPDRTVPTITVLPGYTWSFDHVAVSPNSSLVFVATKAFPVGHPARGTVTITYQGQGPHAFDTDLPPADPSGIATWQFRAIPLNPPRTTFAKIVFSASSPSGYNVGDWASFGAPAIVGSPLREQGSPARNTRARSAPYAARSIRA
jgi:hypothetical protein